jgi:hypothetical protein
MGNPINLDSLVDLSGGWDWKNKHVSQAYIDKTGFQANKQGIAINDIVESGTVLICAGPADFEQALSGSVGIRIVPIGLVDTAQISMSKPLSRIFEIGSRLSYLIPGKTVGAINMSRVFFDGANILKALYMGEVKADYSTVDKKFAKFMSNKYLDSSGNESYQEFEPIGSGQMSINLASSFFDQPTGLAFYFKDQQSDTVSQIYFEGCRISTHQLGISAAMNVLSEGVSIEFIRVRPINTAASYDYIKGTNLADVNIISPLINKG